MDIYKNAGLAKAALSPSQAPDSNHDQQDGRDNEQKLIGAQH